MIYTGSRFPHGGTTYGGKLSLRLQQFHLRLWPGALYVPRNLAFFRHTYNFGLTVEARLKKLKFSLEITGDDLTLSLDVNIYRRVVGRPTPCGV